MTGRSTQSSGFAKKNLSIPYRVRPRLNEDEKGESGNNEIFGKTGAPERTKRTNLNAHLSVIVSLKRLRKAVFFYSAFASHSSALKHCAPMVSRLTFICLRSVNKILEHKSTLTTCSSDLKTFI